MFHNKLPRGRQGLVLDQQLNNMRTDISVVLLAHLLSWLKRLLQLQSSLRCRGRKREKTAVAIFNQESKSVPDIPKPKQCLKAALVGREAGRPSIQHLQVLKWSQVKRKGIGNGQQVVLSPLSNSNQKISSLYVETFLSTILRL